MTATAAFPRRRGGRLALALDSPRRPAAPSTAHRGQARLELPGHGPHTLAPVDRSPPMALFRKKSAMPSSEQALPGRSTPLKVPESHFVNSHRIVPPFPAGLQEAVFALGCFWGAERLFWQLPGVYSTA